MSRTKRQVAAQQTEQRDRRRKWLPITYDGTFDLVLEIHQIVGPLAAEASRLKQPVAVRRRVDEVVDAVSEIVHVAAGLIAESRANPAQTRRAAADLAARPRLPQISDKMIESGIWAMALTEYAAQVSADLASVLGRAIPPGECRNPLPASARIERVLRGLDSAALGLAQRIPRVRERESLPTVEPFTAEQAAKRDADRAARALAKLGAPA